MDTSNTRINYHYIYYEVVKECDATIHQCLLLGIHLYDVPEKTSKEESSS